MSDDAGNTKLYELLGVQKNASDSEIKKVNPPKKFSFADSLILQENWP
jgi:hypothetical protein